MRVELADCTNVLLQEIGWPKTTRDGLSLTYAFAIRSREQTDWAAVNAAIIERWSVSALNYIKARAWGIAEGKIDPVTGERKS